MNVNSHLDPAASVAPQQRESGAMSIEYLGIAVLTAVLIGGIMAFPYAKHLVPGTQASVCTVTTGDSRHDEDGECKNDNKTFIQKSQAQPIPDNAPGPDAAGTKDRQEMIKRGNNWVERGVPYSQEAYTTDPNGKMYRTDCSGFVSMAWGLDQSYSTVTLPNVAHPISKDELQPGDILLKGGPGTAGDAGHVVMFNGWANESHTEYYLLEQAGGQGAISRKVSYPYGGDSSYVPYRKNGM